MLLAVTARLRLANTEVAMRTKYPLAACAWIAIACIASSCAETPSAPLSEEQSLTPQFAYTNTIIESGAGNAHT